MKNVMKIRMLILLLLPLLISVSHAQTITREVFLNQLKQTHPIFDKEKLTAKIEKEEQNSYLGAQDWNFLSSVNLSHKESAIAFAGPERSDVFSIDGGVERMFWKTGGRLSASYSSYYASIKIDPLWGFPDSFYHNKFAITYTHPLLKNRKGFLDRLQHDLKQYDIDFSEVQAQENIEDFLAGSTAKFLDWVILTEQKQIILERLKLSEEERDRTQRKREARLVDQADVMRAEDAVRIWKQNQVLVESHWNALQAELAVLSQNDELYNVGPEFKLYEIEELIPLEEAISHLKENSRLLKTLNIRLKQLEYARKGFEETSKPELSLLAQFNIKNIDEGPGKSLIMDKPDAFIGLQFSVPVENRTAKSQITKTEFQISQLEKQIDDLTLTLTSALTNIHIQLKELESVLILNQEQIKSAKERTKEELKLYNQGRGELTFVILSRDNEENAKLTYAQNALTYHKLTIQYSALMDQLYK